MGGEIVVDREEEEGGEEDEDRVCDGEGREEEGGREGRTDVSFVSVLLSIETRSFAQFLSLKRNIGPQGTGRAVKTWGNSTHKP